MAENKTVLVLNTCDLCGQENLTDEEMKQHMRREHEDDTACPLCGEQGLTGDELWWHISAFHPDDNDGASTVQRDDTDAGVSNGESSKRNREFGSELEGCINVSSSVRDSPASTLQQSNGGSHSFDCCLCPLKFTSSSTLAEHLNAVHDDILSPPRKRDHQQQVLRQNGIVNPTATTSRDNSLFCPMCSMAFKEGQSDALTLHVNTHFIANESRSQVVDKKYRGNNRQAGDRNGANGESSEAGNYKNYGEQNNIMMERAVYQGKLQLNEYMEKQRRHHQAMKSGVDDGESRTAGVIERWQSVYASAKNGNKRVRLCSPTDHFAASYGDRGWGCGYRNLQMMLSCLCKREDYLRVVFGGQALIPSVPKIQRLIEEAWTKGFDPQGRAQLQSSLINTEKWIGATDIATFLTSLHVRCKIVDFWRPTGNEGTHPRLFEWVKEYFRQHAGFVPPIYCQHQGHSRTIVGVEESTSGDTQLLLFDPGRNAAFMRKFLSDKAPYNLMNCVKFGLNRFKAQQYQLVAVDGLMDDAETKASKILKSTRVP